MSTRYSLSTTQAQLVSARLGSISFQFTPRYNIAPGQSAPVVLVENGKLVSRNMSWGWETSSGPLANILAENIRQPQLRAALTERRCLIPADGFYEWKDGKPTHPYRIVRPTRNLFWFAGLWENERFAILTTAATAFVEFIHDREPVAIPASRIDWWFTEPVIGLVREGGIAEMGISNTPLEAYPVTPQTTDPQFESPQC
ncbi:MAG TPA: SOS response-associated peptidase, partial [Desulfuromonadaceae bacterium]|nr:SOS response-associated peptidase [Desulfuromonadaceae bacterium]